MTAMANPGTSANAAATPAASAAATPATPTSPKSIGRKKKKKQPMTVSQLRKQVDTNRQGQEGVAWVAWIVEGMWGCGVEVVSASNDDGVDAIILLKRRPGLKRYAGPTGDLLFVQIKAGYVKKVPTGDYSISFKPEELARWRPKWASYPGPALMVNVIPRRITGGDPVAYWTDLKRPPGSDPNKIEFKLKNCFHETAKSSIYNLCWRWAEFRQIPVIYLDQSAKAFPGEPRIYYMGNKPLRDEARDYFKAWKAACTADPTFQASLQASITWKGWNHITRKARPVRTKQQSIQLLPAAARILLASSGVKPMTVQPMRPVTPDSPSYNSETLTRGYEALTARVIFNERQEAVVRVVLERTAYVSKTGRVKETLVFYSVYEVARRRRSP
ncbi:MAG: DUF4365 domain-containing protein [Rubrivivax sp.]|nr:MAG: DUF4365 domain-containing protein [Rubrivivax sp.]